MKQQAAEAGIDSITRYKSFLLTLWAEPAEEEHATVWRFSLEDPHTGQRRGYADLDTLLEALRQIMAELGVEKGGDEKAKPGD